MISPRGIIGGSVRKGISTPRRALGGSIGTPRQTLGGSIGTPRQIIGGKGGKPMIGTGRKALNEGKEKEMEEVQRDIAVKKEKAQEELFDTELHKGDPVNA